MDAELRFLHPDVAVFIGEFWDTSCTAVCRDGEVMLIDSPVLPGELEQLRALLDRAGLRVTDRLATHAHWDHLLSGCIWPQVPLTCGWATAARLIAEPNRQYQHLAEFDAEHDVVHPPLPLRVERVLDVPGRCSFGGSPIMLVQADGHSADGTACWLQQSRILVCGDYLSPVEIPHVAVGGSIDAYLHTLDRLEALVRRAEAIVPGHGTVLDRQQAASLLAEDRAYLGALRDAPAQASAPLRGTEAERIVVHRENLARVGALSGHPS